jgi:protocatechuate 3,4-dioxygenase beta subunit
LVAFLLLFMTVALSANRQNAATPPAQPEIRGVVLEPGSNQPVADAEILLFVQEPGPIKLNGGWKTEPTSKSKTDYSGSFSFPLDTPGQYRVEAKKTGYSAPGTSATPSYLELTLTAAKPVAEARLYLVHPGEITGHVVDEDTREPIPNVRLRAVRASVQGRFFPYDPSVTTDGDGRFAATNIQPGEYAVEILQQTAPEKRVLTQFTEKDTQTVERDYETTYWPGGHGMDMAMPVTLTSGATVDVGVLPVRKVPYYRAHVRVQGPNCEDGDTIYVSETVRTGQGSFMQALSSVPCGRELLVTGFAPGTYRLGFSIRGRTLETRGSPAVVFSIVNENIEVTAALTPGVTVDGVFLAAEGAKLPDLTKAKVSLFASDLVGTMGSSLPVSPAPDGKFRIEGVPLVDQTVWISGLGPGNYVKEIRYNGVKVAADTVALDSGGMSYTLTVVIDDKPGVIAGAVMSGDKPVSQPFVIARKWPPPDAPMLFRWGLGTARGDDAGRFRIAGLAPGDYHLIALRSLDPSTSNAAFERALSAAKKIEVGPNGIQNVTLEVTDLR